MREFVCQEEINSDDDVTQADQSNKRACEAGTFMTSLISHVLIDDVSDVVTDDNIVMLLFEIIQMLKNSHIISCYYFLNFCPLF